MEQIISFSALDRHFAGFMTALAKTGTPELNLASALLSHQVTQGHVCLDLNTWERRPVSDESEEVFLAPELSDWRAKLKGSGVVGAPPDFKPLILDDHSRLYLYRYWEYENILVERIRRLALHPCQPMTPLPDRCCVNRLFPETSAVEPDWQKIAALMACLKPFLVMTGSPGTGKTTTVARILALLIEQTPSPRLRIALAAPTGKAAARLQEAIRTAKQTLACEPAVKSCIPEDASTVHRLLGSLPGSVHFRHDQRNPLRFDVVVVDEASMLDLPLLSKLIQAMPERARLILLGDRSQLASVEAGAVLGDLCGPFSANCFSREFINEIQKYNNEGLSAYLKTAEAPGMHDCIIHLQKNYRFTGQSDIGRLSEAVKRGEGTQLLQSLKSRSCENAIWFPLSDHHEIETEMAAFIVNGFRSYLSLIGHAGAWEDIFAAFEGFRVLCALRQGPFGVAAINRHIENILEAHCLIRKSGSYYCGQPVMITHNDAQLRLYNGDVGLLLPDPCRNDELSVVFRDSPGRYRRFSPRRLPEHETVYAMTVHKSQGSEFDTVMLMLSDHDAPILTRELVYTGITRARKRIMLWSTESVLITAVSRSIARTSGLRDALWPDHPESHS